MHEHQNITADATQSIRAGTITGPTAFTVSEAELSQLREVIDRWERFLDIVFSHPSTRKMDQDVFERLSMEDAERYLDVKIQLSQCIGAAGNESLQAHFDDRFNAIRRLTYRYITKDLPALCDNSRNLMALARGRAQSEGPDQSNESAATGAGVDPGLRYKDGLVLRRQKLKTRISRQQAEVLQKIQDLRKVIAEQLQPFVREAS